MYRNSKKRNLEKLRAKKNTIKLSEVMTKS